MNYGTDFPEFLCQDCDAHDLWADLAHTDLEQLFPPSAQHVSMSTNVLWAPPLFANPRYRAGLGFRV